MIEIRVCRGSTVPSLCETDDTALNWGADIMDSLLASEEAASERGRVEIDNSFSNRKNVSISIHGIGYTQLGQIVAIDEGTYENGLLKSLDISYSISKDSISVGTSLVVERTI